MKISPFYSRFKIKDQIFSVMLLLLVIFCVIGIFIFSFFSRMYENEIYRESAEKLQLSSAVLDKELEEIEKLSFQISTDNFIQNSLVFINENESEIDLHRRKAELINALVTFATQEKYISSIQIHDKKGKKYVAGYQTKVTIDTEELRRLAVEAEGANIWTGLEKQNKITASRVIRGKENINLKHLGTLFITINMDKLLHESLDIPNNNDFVIARQKEIVYMSHYNELDVERFSFTKSGRGYEMKEINGLDYLVAFHESEYADFTYYHFIPFASITKQTIIIKQWMILCFLFMLALTIYLSRRAAITFSKPLEELTEQMKKVQKGEFEQIEFNNDLSLENEVGQLNKDFQTMVNEINILIEENYKKQLIIKDTEYQALQAQINPHFLYNTLDSINWMAKVNKQPNISSMAESLGKLMRNIISKKEPLISLSDELQIVNNYVTIQKYRYNDRLNFSIKVEPDLEDLPIPKLSIQPIVENAIQHGVEESIAGCDIYVNITSTDQENLMIIVEDTGPGMDESTISSIFTGDLKPKGTGIGLRNINERVRLLFGEKYGIEIETEIGRGTRVIITIPCMWGE
ncbi:sensor histidine kinase [Ferdinandcohnia sp. Marseille-Q9671]